MDPSRRAAAGEMGRLEAGEPSRDGLAIRVRMRCPGEASCAGVVIARNMYGADLASTPLAVGAGDATTVTLKLASASDGYLRGMHISIKQ